MITKTCRKINFDRFTIYVYAIKKIPGSDAGELTNKRNPALFPEQFYKELFKSNIGVQSIGLIWINPSVKALLKSYPTRIFRRFDLRSDPLRVRIPPYKKHRHAISVPVLFVRVTRK